MEPPVETGAQAGGRRRIAVLVVAACAVTAGVVVFLPRGERRVDLPPDEEALEPLVESPRPPVQAEPPAATLRGRPAPRATREDASDRASLLHERNARAKDHRLLVSRFEAGVASIRDVEEAEVRLLDARHRLGELDAPAWHRSRAVLVARAAERAHLAVEVGILPAGDEGRVRLALELERMLAGDPHTYPASRDAFLASVRDRNSTMVMAGLASAKTLNEEYARLEAEFPPADDARAADR